ncbi:TetR/AcrR family transcriptional regulator [Paenibacillus sp. NPDC056722]|uniref:TetR/AcrR family transcriptional regulator n=1 Tax=Paenibacillus sp. NPDC056722 TaxID=3345924 RepID=UPI0036B31CFA
MNGFEKRSALIKEKITSVTLEMLKTWEPKRMRITDIAKTANVSQVTIYKHFGSKEELLRETLKHLVEQSTSEFEAFIHQEPSMKEIVQYILGMKKGTYTLLRPSLVQTLMIDDPEMFQYLQMQYAERTLPLMVRMVEEGQARGEISSKVSANAVLMYMQMYMKSMGEMLEQAKAEESLDTFMEETLHLFFYGIFGREAGEQEH